MATGPREAKEKKRGKKGNQKEQHPGLRLHLRLDGNRRLAQQTAAFQLPACIRIPARLVVRLFRFDHFLTSSRCAASASYKYPNACPASFVDCWLTAFRCLFLSCPVLSCLVCCPLLLSPFSTPSSRVCPLVSSLLLLYSSSPHASRYYPAFRLLRSNPPLLSLIGHLTGALFCDAADTPAGWHQGGYRPKWTGQHQKNGRE
ncbi:hypothetical protein V8C43DRAFT_241519 [Trichoderma afarasin]